MRIGTAPVLGVVVPLAGVLACAAPPPSIERAPGSRPSVTGTVVGTSINLENDAFVKEGLVEGSVADVWRVLPLAWGDAMVPVNGRDNALRTLQSGPYKAPSRIVGQSLSQYFDCGYSIAGPRVTLWQVMMDVLTAVLPDSAGMTRVATTIDASARPRDGTSSNAVPCTSKGELERIILGNVKERMGG